MVLEQLAGWERTSASKATTRSGHGQYFAAGVGGKGCWCCCTSCCMQKESLNSPFPDFQARSQSHSTCLNLDHWTLRTVTRIKESKIANNFQMWQASLARFSCWTKMPLSAFNEKFPSSMWDVVFFYFFSSYFVDLIHWVSHRRWHNCRCRSCKRSWGNRWMHGKRRKWTLGW